MKPWLTLSGIFILAGCAATPAVTEPALHANVTVGRMSQRLHDDMTKPPVVSVLVVNAPFGFVQVSTSFGFSLKAEGVSLLDSPVQALPETTEPSFTIAAPGQPADLDSALRNPNQLPPRQP